MSNHNNTKVDRVNPQFLNNREKYRGENELIGLISINIPITNRIKLMIRRTIYLLFVTDNRASLIAMGIREKEKSQDMIDDADTKNKTVAEITSGRDFLRTFFSLINNKDPEALAELKYSAHYLARAILHIVSLISPQKIYLGGTLILAGEVLLEFLKEELNNFVLIKLQEPNLLEFSKLSKNAMLCGAAFLWIEEEISLPETKGDGLALKEWGNGDR